MSDESKCPRCESCGKIANDEDGTLWTYWASLPPGSDVAVLAGIVRPIPCPECKGSGTKEPPR